MALAAIGGVRAWSRGRVSRPNRARRMAWIDRNPARRLLQGLELRRRISFRREVGLEARRGPPRSAGCAGPWPPRRSTGREAVPFLPRPGHPASVTGVPQPAGRSRGWGCGPLRRWILSEPVLQGPKTRYSGSVIPPPAAKTPRNVPVLPA
jgi:hypothetical protein